MRRIYSSKTIETHSGLSANNLVYMCLHIPTNQPAPHSPGHWTALAPSGTFFSTKVAFSRLDTDFCSRSCQNNGRAPFCQPHIAADHRDMQRLWINYFTGNRTSPAVFFFFKTLKKLASERAQVLGLCPDVSLCPLCYNSVQKF